MLGEGEFLLLVGLGRCGLKFVRKYEEGRSTCVFVPHGLNSGMFEEKIIEFATESEGITKRKYGVNGKFRCRYRWFNGPCPFPREYDNWIAP